MGRERQIPREALRQIIRKVWSPGGGLRTDDSWIGCGKHFFLPVRILRTIFRGKLLSKLERALADGEIPLQEGTGKLLLRKAPRVT